MNVRVFSKFIMALGGILLGCGAMMYMYSKLTVATLSRANDEQIALSAPYRLEHNLNHSPDYLRFREHNIAMLEEASAYEPRGTSTGIAGTIILFLGFAAFSASSPAQTKRGQTS